MFKILAVVCTLGGDCSSFISEDQATHATLRAVSYTHLTLPTSG